MPFTVRAQEGDCLCTVAFSRGLADCTTLRTVAANAGFLAAPLARGDVITLPDPPLLHIQTLANLLGARAWIVQLPPLRFRASTVQFIRKTAAAAAAPNVINDIGVSRFVTRSVSENGADDWPDHTQRDYDANSAADPNTFAIAVHDPNPGGNTVSVVLEALKPLYDHTGARNGHRRYPAGPLRAERSCVVTAEKLAALRATDDFWSCDLRLVVDDTDKQMRPAQTLWIKDLFDERNPEDVQILDHDIYARYEYSECPRAAGEKCVLAEATIPMRRGESVGLELRILRAQADGSTADNGLVRQAVVRRRVARNCRRFYAQEELTFTVNRLETIDPPSDMLVVAEPNGELSAGARPAPNAAQVGEVVLQITLDRHDGTSTVYNIPAVAVANGNTPRQTADALVTAINNNCAGDVTAAATTNAVDGAEPRGCADVLLASAAGLARVTAISDVADQDSAQIVRLVHFNVGSMDDDQQTANEMRRAAPPMRRLLFKSAAIHATRINIWVVNEDRGGLTTTAMRALHGAGLATDASVRNCITMKSGAMDDQYDFMAVTLAHEIAHALADCDHVPAARDNMSILHPGQVIAQQFYDDKRISGPGSPNHPVDQVSNAGPAWQIAPDVGPSGASPLGVVRLNTTLHALIAANTSITKTAR
jgi:hypothetical protein